MDKPEEQTSPATWLSLLPQSLTIYEIEREVILFVLGRLKGNRTHTARALNIAIRTLQRKLREYKEAGFQVTDYSCPWDKFI